MLSIAILKRLGSLPFHSDFYHLVLDSLQLSILQCSQIFKSCLTLTSHNSDHLNLCNLVMFTVLWHSLHLYLVSHHFITTKKTICSLNNHSILCPPRSWQQPCNFLSLGFPQSGYIIWIVLCNMWYFISDFIQLHLYSKNSHVVVCIIILFLLWKCDFLPQMCICRCTCAHICDF